MTLIIRRPSPHPLPTREALTHEVLPARLWFRDGERPCVEHKVVGIGEPGPSPESGWYEGTNLAMNHGVLTTFDDGSKAWAFGRLWSRPNAELLADNLRKGRVRDPAG